MSIFINFEKFLVKKIIMLLFCLHRVCKTNVVFSFLVKLKFKLHKNCTKVPTVKLIFDFVITEKYSSNCLWWTNKQFQKINTHSPLGDSWHYTITSLLTQTQMEIHSNPTNIEENLPENDWLSDVSSSSHKIL